MGAYSGTPNDQIQLYRCGNSLFPGCGKVLTEGQKKRHGCCPYCGSIAAVTYYPRTKWAMFKAILLTLRTGELWLREEDSKQMRSGQERS